jgi:hypothetical protein
MIISFYSLSNLLSTFIQSFDHVLPSQLLETCQKKVEIKVKVKVAQDEAMKTQSGSRGISTLSLP